MPRFYRYAIIAALVAGAGVIAGVIVQRAHMTLVPQGPHGAPLMPFAVKVTPGVEARYLNTSVGFSFGIPDGLLAQEATDGAGVTTVKLHDAAAAPYLQVIVAPTKSGPAAFTPEDVARAAPGTAIASSTVVQIASGVGSVSAVNGVEFDSTNAAWAGPSRELWFSYKGYRYQISVKQVNAALLEYVRKSWQWR